MNKENKILIPILIAIGIIALTYYFIVPKIQEYQLQKENSKQELQAMQAKIAELENKPEPVVPAPQIIEKTIIKNIPAVQQVATPTPIENTTEDVISYWGKKAVYVICEWSRPASEPNFYASGSGTLVAYVGSDIRVVTNRHVIQDSNGYGPNKCLVSVPGFEDIFVDITYIDDTGLDLGFIKITNPSESLIKVARGTPHCNNVTIGEKLVVIGYPSTGSDEGITVTEGIVSGTDGKYYTTSAKIESGNSGGMAISVKNNCYIGIPSYVMIGKMESLGRILSSKFIFGN